MTFVSNLRREDGVALPVAVGVLLLIGILAAGVAANAMSSSSAANQDRSSKRALAAANAGLETAVYALNTVRPSDGYCPTSPATQPLTADGLCQEQGGTAAAGATWSYRISPAKPPNEGCSGYSLPPQSLPAGSQVRCITSTGAVDGVSRRVQTRMLALPANPPYLPVHGVFGLKSVTIGQHPYVGGSLGSNGTITVGSNPDIDLIELGPPPATGPGGLPTVRRPQPFTLQDPPVAGTQLDANNNNEALAAYSGWTESERSLTVNGALFLPTGDYNFCRLTLGAAATIAPQAGATVRIFIDVPEDVRAGSGCPQTVGQGWGEWSFNNGNGITVGEFANGDPVPTAERFQVFVVGWEPDSPAAARYGRSEVLISKNRLSLNGMIYAPHSYVEIGKNNSNSSEHVFGGIAGRDIVVKNSFGFDWDASLDDEGANGGNYTRAAWSECTPTARAGGPEAGC